MTAWSRSSLQNGSALALGSHVFTEQTQGTYLGTLESVNHLDLIGWLNAARYKWAEVRGKKIKFSPATFYLSNVDMLARGVEGQTNAEAPSYELLP